MSSRVFVWQAMLVGFVAVALILFWAFAVYRWHVYPYETLVTIRDFVRGVDSDKRSLKERLRSEFGFDPVSFATTEFSDLLPPESFAPVRAAPDASGVLPDLSGMRYFHDDGPYRVYVVFGSFAFTQQERNWGAIAVDTDGMVHRAWVPRPDRSEYLGAHIGLALGDDGLVTTNTNGVLTGYEWCGPKRWEAPWAPHPDGRRRHHDSADGYDWHHDVTVVGDSVYTFRGSAIVEVDAATGEIRSEVHALDLLEAAWRDDLSIFETRRKGRVGPDVLTRDSFHRKFHIDPWHFNKVDVLDPERAADYPGFEAGDMLISLRELNLVVVFRPSEARILWWRHGLFAAQHDASFIEGQIEIFDNNPHSVPPRPRILRLDLDDQAVDTLIDLSTWGMVMREKGNFERRGDRILTVDDDAGRVIAGRLDGSLEFVLENDWLSADGNTHRLQLRNATEVDPADFARWQAACKN